VNDPDAELAAAYVAAIEAGDDDLADALADEIDDRGRADHDARENRLTAPGALGRAAVFYAAHGWAVFPLVPGGKVPATTRGFHDATTDVERVATWWRLKPTANIGLATGGASGVDVIDLDGVEGVREWFGHPDAERPPLLGRAMTPRPGGWHLYVPASGRGNRARMAPGIDYRGAGGYVVLPPSWSTERSGRYVWVDVPAILGGRP
jgi:Bifunctional DNA primase/polymerase, N-terminal